VPQKLIEGRLTFEPREDATGRYYAFRGAGTWGYGLAVETRPFLGSQAAKPDEFRSCCIAVSQSSIWFQLGMVRDAIPCELRISEQIRPSANVPAMRQHRAPPSSVVGVNTRRSASTCSSTCRACVTLSATRDRTSSLTGAVLGGTRGRSCRLYFSWRETSRWYSGSPRSLTKSGSAAISRS
jgi:hypothetical protein